MLGMDSWQANDPDAIMFCGGWREVRAAVRRHFMSVPCQPLPGSLIVRFNAAIPAAYTTPADVRNSQGCGDIGLSASMSLPKALVHPLQNLEMLFLPVPFSHQFASCL